MSSETRVNGLDMKENPTMAANGVTPTQPPEGDTSEKDAEEKKKDEPMKMVGALEIFRFADCKDRLLMIAGTLGACVHGCALPVLMVIFGEMSDGFINHGALRNVLLRLNRFNYTIDSIMSNRSRLVEVLDRNNVTGTDRSNVLGLFGGNLFEQMQTFALIYVVVAFVVFALAYFQVGFWSLAAARQTRRIRRLFFHAIMRKDIGWFDTHEVGELNTRLSDDIQKILAGIGDKLGNSFQYIFAFFSGFIIAFIRGWQLTLVVLAVTPVLGVCVGVMTWLQTMLTSKELKAYAKAGAVAEEVLSSMRTVVAFGGEKKECERYNSNLGEARALGIRRGVIDGLGMAVMYFVMFASYALAFWFGARLVREGTFSGGQILIVLFCVLIAAFSIGSVGPNVQFFSAARGAAYAIYSIIDHEPEIDSQSEEGDVIDDFKGNIEFRDVKFCYPSRKEVQVLDGLNLKVDVGQTVALVGSSGCGKSTTVQLLQRFYDPEEGQVMLDGRDIRELNIRWLRQQIGVVSQEPVLFATTIQENIRYGRDGVTIEEIQQACKEANAHDFICALPDGYGTLVGERGAQLSGGQKQRIAIARALVRNPKVLLLDEATSALDTESESVVQNALDKARMGRTTIVIAHRLSTVRTADKLAGIDKGVVSEEGTHDELMQKHGIYYKLVTNQQKGVKDDDEDEFEIDEKTGIHTVVSEATPEKKLPLSRIKSQDEKTEEEEEEEEDLPQVALKRVMRMNAPEWPYIVAGCIAALINGGIQPAFAIIFSEFLGVFARDPDRQEERANFFSLMFLVIALVAGLGMLIQTFAFAKSGQELTMRLRQMTFKALMRQNIAYFDDHRHTTGALTTRLAVDTSSVQGATGARLGTVAQSLCSVGVGILLGFVFSWKLSLVILAFVPVLLLSGYIEMQMWTGTSLEDKTAVEEAGKFATEAVVNIRTVASLTKEPYFDIEYNRQMDIPYQKSIKKTQVHGGAYALSQAVLFFAYAASFSYGAWLVQHEGLPFQDMFKVFSAIVFGAMSVGNATAFAPDYGKAKIAANRLFFLYDQVPPIDTYSEEGTKPLECQGEIQFENVNFNYPTRPDIQVLRELNLSVQPGQRLALVGSSGCGKSTTVQLIERFYDPLEGAVKIDGAAATDLNIQWMRSKIGIVSQEPILFDTSIADNIAYGDNEREVPMDEIIAAARSANIHSFIESLPSGYDTNVGDKGTQLSGGQKQRVAIARALLRNPKILLLDEATSALDTESEKVVQEALDKAQEGRTSIVIAHRLSTIQNADCICVIHKGQVVEMGKHAELLGMKGIYYKLNNASSKKQ